MDETNEKVDAPSLSLREPKHAYRAACTRIDNRIISREPARRLMSALMNNRATYGPVCRRSINSCTNGYREFTTRNPDIRLCAIPSIHPSIPGFWIPFLLLFRWYSLLDVRMFEDNDSRFEIEFFFFLFFSFGILLDVRLQQIEIKIICNVFS